MRDFFYPLPLEKLKERYAPLFDVVRKRQSGSFIGLPASAKSGYLRFLLEEKKILRSMLPGFDSEYKILYFEPIPLTTKNSYHWLFQLSIQLEIFDPSYSHVQAEDPVILLTNIQKYLIGLAKENKHLTIVISSPKVWERLPKEAAFVLRAIWDTYRKPPRNPCSLIFLFHSKCPSSEQFTQFYDPLREAMNENYLFFPIMDRAETDYTLDRFVQFLNLSLKGSYKQLIYELTGGYYPLIQLILKLIKSLQLKVSSGTIKSIVNNKVIIRELTNLWSSFDEAQKVEITRAAKGILTPSKGLTTLQNLGLISKENRVEAAWIRSFILERKYKVADTSERIPTKSYLKGKEYVVYRGLLAKQGEVVTRGEIAEILWDKDVREKYSDWAIDKVISRIRKKLKQNYSTNSIITLKKQGYVLLT